MTSWRDAEALEDSTLVLVWCDERRLASLEFANLILASSALNPLDSHERRLQNAIAIQNWRKWKARIYCSELRGLRQNHLKEGSRRSNGGNRSGSDVTKQHKTRKNIEWQGVHWTQFDRKHSSHIDLMLATRILSGGGEGGGGDCFLPVNLSLKSNYFESLNGRYKFPPILR